jgi:hypothetical protein
MTQLEAMLYATLRAHRPLVDEETSPNVWRTMCACHAVVVDHDEHVTRELARVVLQPEAAPNGVVAGVRWEQMTLV